jgi:hypothetical protein
MTLTAPWPDHALGFTEQAAAGEPDGKTDPFALNVGGLIDNGG